MPRGYQPNKYFSWVTEIITGVEICVWSHKNSLGCYAVRVSENLIVPFLCFLFIRRLRELQSTNTSSLLTPQPSGQKWCFLLPLIWEVEPAGRLTHHHIFWLHKTLQLYLCRWQSLYEYAKKHHFSFLVADHPGAASAGKIERLIMRCLLIKGKVANLMSVR